jgi:hypothetical protein
VFKKKAVVSSFALLRCVQEKAIVISFASLHFFPEKSYLCNLKTFVFKNFLGVRRHQLL